MRQINGKAIVELQDECEEEEAEAQEKGKEKWKINCHYYKYHENECKPPEQSYKINTFDTENI